MSTPAYQTIIVKFREAITELDGIFRDMQFWGVATLKEWIDDYEGSRFTAIDTHTAVITSEYNMECLLEWLKRHTPIAVQLLDRLAKLDKRCLIGCVHRLPSFLSLAISHLSLSARHSFNVGFTQEKSSPSV